MFEKYDYDPEIPNLDWSCYKSNEKPAVNQISEHSGLCHEINFLILSSTAFYSGHVPPCISTSKNDLYCTLLLSKSKADGTE